jgi:NitT/TauT family transport system substrate-binding protein
VTRKAKDILATSDAEWDRIARLTGAADAAALAVYRERYREGIPRRPIDAEEQDAQTLFRVLAAQGGRSLVGSATALDPKTFFHARPGG